MVFNRDCCPGTVFMGGNVVALMERRQGWKTGETGYVNNIVCGYFIFSYSLNLLYLIRFTLKHFLFHIHTVLHSSIINYGSAFIMAFRLVKSILFESFIICTESMKFFWSCKSEALSHLNIYFQRNIYA